ncbi:PQQ-binding-like beta-propeller repeat protein [Streptomyces sp. NPDC087897]|uniref:outer membrane protein assembly factor BamB family protein n=1 Tax=Streptomyces sp. NPDC087897 TaxID=3365817 RepID=UPI00382C8BB4
MPDAQQPWYEPGAPQQPVPGNPYVSGPGAPQAYGPPPPGGAGYGPPTPPPPPPPGRRFGRGPVVAAVVALVLIVVAGGVYAATDRGRSEPAKPVAKKSPGPSASASPSSAPPAGGPELSHIPTTKEVAAARKPGEAAAWIADDRTDIPKQFNKVHDLWIVGDTAVQALYRKVTAYRLSDGAEVWSVTLPSTVCQTPANPTPDGKVVVLHHESATAERMNPCSRMQMIDLKTGKKGWKKELVSSEPDDSRLLVYSAISGGTFAVTHDMKASAYRVDDGKKLYDIPRENGGKCFPENVAGGSRLLVSLDCSVSFDRSKNYSLLREIDPRTGKLRWRHQTPAGWQFGLVISVDPAVFTTFNTQDSAADWRVSSLGPGGKLRATFDPRKKGFEHCGGDGAGSEAQPCRGAGVGKGLIMLGGQDQVGAYDMKTGKFLWGIKDNRMRTLHPLRAEDGNAMLIYEAAGSSTPGRTYLMGPRGAGTETNIVKHPAATAPWEYEMSMGQPAYVDGRLVLTPAHVSGDENRKPVREARMLSFVAGSP